MAPGPQYGHIYKVLPKSAPGTPEMSVWSNPAGAHFCTDARTHGNVGQKSILRLNNMDLDVLVACNAVSRGFLLQREHIQMCSNNANFRVVSSIILQLISQGITSSREFLKI